MPDINLFLSGLLTFNVFTQDCHFDTVNCNHSKASRADSSSALHRIHLEVVEGQEGLGLSSLLLDVLNTISAGLLRVNDDGVHVLAQHFCHGNLILLLSGLAQVDQTAVLQK